MVEALARNWWVFAVRGVLSILFGIAAFIWPGITLMVLVLLFGAYVLVDGIFAIVSAIRGEAGERWWVLLLEGLVGIAAGILTFFWPGITAVALLYLIAAYAIITGILEIIAAIRLRREIEGEWALVLGGIASVILGVLIAIWPGAGALTVVWLIGAYAIVFGILMLVLAFRLRNWSETPGAVAGQQPTRP